VGAFGDELFDSVDLVAVSPGVPLSEPALARAAARGLRVVGDIELFAQTLHRGSDAGQPRIIAITGTNGKSTVTALAGAMCRAAGLDSEVAGNIGPPVLDAFERRAASGVLPRAWVLELSSFQLETTHSLRADAATVLNVSEDHLDRYASLDAYCAAKARILHEAGVQVLNRDDPRSLGMRQGGSVVTFGVNAPGGGGDYGLLRRDGECWLAEGPVPLLAVRDTLLAGLHNAANALAALALCRAIGLPLAPLLQALREFRGLPHRVELVREANGVRYYDDSKGTNVGSTAAALAGLAGNGAKVVLIAGGDGKGQDFSPLAEPVQRAARCVVLIGRDAPAIERALQGRAAKIRHAATLDAAVDAAAEEARPGDAVLLSPACASFDMFRDYRHRGAVFRAAVERLGGGRPGARA
jgi:UDP-N-acetylmuramoylalanine--D-glutamate ligase